MKLVATLKREVANFGPALVDLESVGVYHTAPLPYGTEAESGNSRVHVVGPGQFVLGLFGQLGQPSAFMIPNRDHEHPAEGVFGVSLPGGRVQ